MKKTTLKKCIIVGIPVLVALILFLTFGVPALALHKANLETATVQAELNGTLMEKVEGEQVIAKSDNTTLYFNPATMELRLKNADGQWLSYVKKSTTATDKALLVLNYLGEDNNLYTWDTDSYCAQLGTYEVYQIENGVKIAMDVNEGESARFYEYLPKKMSIDEFHNVFEGGLDKALADGTITEDVYNRYSMTLGLVYKQSILEECYSVTYLGSPPASATKQMIAIAGIVGYTHEMLEADAEAFGFALTTTEVPEFTLNMYITLEGDELVVRVPSTEMASLNSYFKIQDIEVLPNFGAVTPDQQESGYLFVPDGAGALMALNSYKSGVTNYERAVYDNDYFSDYYYMSEWPEDLTMPIYGMIYGELGAETQSYLAIIEKGDESSFICTELASTSADGAVTNKIYSRYDVAQYQWAKVYGAYSDNSASYLVTAPSMAIDYTVRFRFFGKGASYYDMATSYRDYLVAQKGLTLDYEDDTELYLDVIGALDVKDHFLGIPYSRTVSMTTYSQLQEILENYADADLLVSYEGVFNGGMNNTLYTGLSTVSKNGSSKELKALKDYAAGRNMTLAFAATPEQVYNDNLSYRTGQHALKDYANIAVTVYRYALSTGKLSGYMNSSASYYELLSPYYLESAVSKFLKKADSYEALYLPKLGHLPYADYDNSDMVDIQTAENVVSKSLESMDASHSLVLDDPYIKNIDYTAYATSVSRESSDYATFAYTIPFRQLVLNGLTTFTTETVNMSSHNPQYFVLQAAELGAVPKFTLTGELEDVLRHTDYSYLYAVNFDNQKSKVDDMLASFRAVREEIGSNEIVGHETLAEGVHKTTYANGCTVLVNYNLYDVTLEDGTVLAAESYEITKGKE